MLCWRLSGDLLMRLGETVTLPNEQRMEGLEAVVRLSRRQACAVENLLRAPHTQVRLQYIIGSGWCRKHRRVTDE
jgi:hypothetical protein